MNFSFEINENNQRVEKVIIRNENEKTYTDLVEMILEKVNIEKQKHKKHSTFKNQMKSHVLSKARKKVKKMAERRKHQKHQKLNKLMSNFVFLTRL
jgi:hypothetical protein